MQHQKTSTAVLFTNIGIAIFLIGIATGVGILSKPIPKPEAEKTERKTRVEKALPQAATASPTWWNQEEVSADLKKIRRAIARSEAMTNPAMRRNVLFSDRLTLRTADGDVFVEIMPDGTVRVGDISSNKQIKGTQDGAMPTMGTQELSPNDTIGYEQSLNDYGFSQRSFGISRNPLTPMRYADIIHKVANATFGP